MNLTFESDIEGACSSLVVNFHLKYKMVIGLSSVFDCELAFSYFLSLLPSCTSKTCNKLCDA